MNSMSFGEYVKAGGFIQKTIPGTTIILSKQSNQHQQVNRLAKLAENNSRRGPEASTKGWGPPITGTGLPAPPVGRPACLWGPHVTLSFLCQFPTTFESPSPPLLKVGSSNGDRGS